MRACNRKKDFPIFRQDNLTHFVYLDSAATSYKPDTVIDAIANYYESYCANIGRGIYPHAEETTHRFEETRKKLAQWFSVSPQEVMFTKSATEGINIFARIWAQYHIQKGDRIILSDVEHHSNVVVWQELASQVGAYIDFVETKYGVIQLDALQKSLTKKTKLVSLVHTSNIFGTTNDIAKIANIVHGAGALLFVDGCQSAPHQKIDLQALGCDAFVCSAHKMLGPTGAGLLYVRKNVHTMVKPASFGGGMVHSVDYDKAEYKPFPQGFEAGTQPIASVIGWGKAIEYLEKIDQKQEHNRLCRLAQRLYAYLTQCKDVVLVSPDPQVQPTTIITWYHKTLHAHDIAAVLGKWGIAVRAGNHCVQPYHTKHKLPSTIRMSLYVYNDSHDIDVTIQALEKLFSTSFETLFQETIL